MSCRGGGGGKRERKKDVWDVEGGYMGVKKQKLEEQFTEQANLENQEGGIFKGVAIFVNGRTEPTSEELKRLMMTHGGTYHHYMSSRTTHIIASNLPDVKVRQLKGNEIIVKPDWIVACIEAGRLLDFAPFLLYTSATNGQRKIQFQPVHKYAEAESVMPMEEDEKIVETVEEHDSPSDVKSVSNLSATEGFSPQKAKDARDTRFLGEFYSNSRLHHISSMGARAKEYVTSLREGKVAKDNFPARQRLIDLHGSQDDGSSSGSMVMHIDMDCFFVSVGLRKRPDLKGLPVAVTHARGNREVEGEQRGSMSEIASCSYEARKMGVKNGMFLGAALKLCPDLQTIPYDFPGYEEVSRHLYDTVAAYTLDIQAVSCDELLVDLGPLCKELSMDPLLFATRIRSEVEVGTKCPCSVGLGSNMLLARLALKLAKPAGQAILRQEQAEQALEKLQVMELPGVGRNTVAKLASIGACTVGDLRQLSLAKLQANLGAKTGQQLFNMARGRDDRKVQVEHVRKTVSAEVNYGIRFASWKEAETFLGQLAGEVAERLKNVGKKGRSITLKLMVRADGADVETSKFLGHGVCDNLSRSSQLLTGTDSAEAILREVVTLAKAVGAEPDQWRGVGVSIARLEDGGGSNQSLMRFLTKGNKDTCAEKERNDIAGHSKAEPKALKSSDSKSVEGSSDISVNLDVENSKMPDPSFLAALPPDLREEVEAEWRRIRGDLQPTDQGRGPAEQIGKGDAGPLGQSRVKTCPPDASERTEKHSQSSKIEEDEAKDPEILEVDIGSKHDRYPGVQSHESPLTLTQLDPEFLAEMPEDIREELEEQQRERKRQIESKRLKNRKEEMSERGRWSSGETASISPAEVSFSQLDPEVLAALPGEMVEEVREQYKRKREGNGSALNGGGNAEKTAFDALMKSKQDPTKKCSPAKLTKGKRGRPKGSVNKIKKGGRKKGVRDPALKETLVSNPGGPLVDDHCSNQEAVVDMEVFEALPDYLKQEVQDQMKERPIASTSRRVLFEDSNSRASDSSLKIEAQPVSDYVETTTDSTQDTLLEKRKKNVPMFCGETTISRVRPLLKSWLASGNLPKENDLQMLGNFLKDLVLACKLDMAHILLKCLHRNILVIIPESEHWKDAWRNLANQVQAVTVQIYGKQLRLLETF